MIAITEYNAATLPRPLYRVLFNLNFRDRGRMQHEFRRRNPQDIYYVLTDDELVVGWAMTLRREYEMRGERMVWYYIRQRLQGNGFGLKLAMHIKNREGILASYTNIFRF